MHKPVNTHDTVVRVRGVLWCAKNLDRTQTCGTHFGSTAGLTVPMLNANGKTLDADFQHQISDDSVTFLKGDFICTQLNHVVQ